MYEEVQNNYRPRIIDAMISEKLSFFGGAEITGPRGCGKSWTGTHNSRSSFFLGDEDAKSHAALDPQGVLKGEVPRLIDEWQDVTDLWDVAKRNISFDKKAKYIFTRSSSPKKKPFHPGTGRIVTLRMRTMSMYESGDSSGKISMQALFDTGKADNAPSKMNYPKIIQHICIGGWPEAIGRDEKEAIEVPYDYVRALINKDENGKEADKRSARTMDMVLRSLARNTATTASIPTIVADVIGEGNTISEASVFKYLDHLRRLFVIDEQNAWYPYMSSKIRIRASPKRHFTDPSLAAAALGAKPDILIKDTRTAGLMFESLCYRDLSIYADAFRGRVSHYRDNSGLEVDAVVQIDGRRWGAVEVKLGRFEFDKAATNLLRMKKKMTDAGAEEPSFLMILHAAGGGARTRPDGVVEVPIDCLGP